MEEIWKPVKNFENRYLISNFGKIKRIENCIIRKNGKKQSWKEKLLKPTIDAGGYYSIRASKQDKKTKTLRIHRLVAETFIDNPFNLECVNHIDGDKTNNDVRNLEWCSRSYNIKHAFKTGLCNNLLKPVIQYDLKGNYINEYPSAREAERQLGFRNQGISLCCKRKYKSSFGFVWRYKNDVF